MAEPLEIFHAESGCRRCGTCCEKGGPSLHLADKPLVVEGHIPLRCLFTIRKGERVRDNVRGGLVPLNREIIKIRGRDGRWTCHFYDRDNRGCGIYASRPMECRVLDCRDTRGIEAVYAVDRMTREDLLGEVSGLWELVCEHEQRCGYDRLWALMERGPVDGRYREEAAMLEMLRYDTHLRQLMVEKSAMDAGMLDFLLGRALTETIQSVGLGLVKRGGDYHLVPGADSR